MMNRRKHRIAFAIGSLAATAGFMIVAVPLVPRVTAGVSEEMPPPHVMRYGAIAYAPSGAWGTARGYQVKAQAERVALDQCGDQDCRVIISFNLCGAVASDGSSYQGGTGLTRAAAESAALNKLGGGRIVRSVCN